MSRYITICGEEFVGGTPVRESVPVEQLQEGKYQILASPGYANGFAAGDILEVRDSAGHFRVLERGGNVCVQIFFAGDKEKTRKELDQRFAGLKGWLDGGQDSPTGHLLIGSGYLTVALCRMARL